MEVYFTLLRRAASRVLIKKIHAGKFLILAFLLESALKERIYKNFAY